MGDQPRLFVEWYDPANANWGGFFTSDIPQFHDELAQMVAQCGPPTHVEFRAANEGCEINGVDCPRTEQSFGSGPLYKDTR